jgi:hypothetical protein
MLKNMIIYASLGGIIIAATLIQMPSAVADQCFWNQANSRVYISIIWAQGGILNFTLEPGGRYRVPGNYQDGSYYCYDYQPLGGGCPNRLALPNSC